MRLKLTRNHILLFYIF